MLAAVAAAAIMEPVLDMAALGAEMVVLAVVAVLMPLVILEVEAAAAEQAQRATVGTVVLVLSFFVTQQT